MHPSQQRNIPRLAHRDADEERAWTRVYRRTRDASVAAEVVHQLDLDPEAKRWHLALYLRCRHTLRRRKARQQRRQRLARLVRAVVGALMLRPLAAIGGWLRSRERGIPTAPEPRLVRAARVRRPMLIEASPRAAVASAVSPAADMPPGDEKVA